MASVKGLLGAGVPMLVAGIALLAWAVSSGDAEFYLVVIIPVISGTGPAFGGGVLLFMLGLVVTFMGLSLRSLEALDLHERPPSGPTTGPGTGQKGEVPPVGGTQFGGVIFLGPIPIVFGKGQRAGRWMLVASIVFGILMIVFLLGIFL
jgi:uncharacterized protein (TIGR00304 family)